MGLLAAVVADVDVAVVVEVVVAVVAVGALRTVPKGRMVVAVVAAAMAVVKGLAKPKCR